MRYNESHRCLQTDPGAGTAPWPTGRRKASRSPGRPPKRRDRARQRKLAIRCPIPIGKANGLAAAIDTQQNK